MTGPSGVNNNSNHIVFSDGKSFDINLLDQLIGQNVKGNIWAQYNSAQKGGNNNNIFDKAEIEALKNDLINSSKNGIIDSRIIGNLLSNNDFETYSQVRNEFEILMNEQNSEKEVLPFEKERNDAIKADVKKLNLSEIFRMKDKISEPLPRPEKDEPAQLQDGKTAYLETYKDYQPKDKQKYQIVKEYVRKNMAAQNSGYADPAKVEGVTKMISALSDNYGVDPEIVAGILNIESGGYQFIDHVMVHEGSKYKGVMQVDFTTIECLYADPDAWKENGQNLTKHEYAVSYDHKHYAADDARINELKMLYPEPEDLYKAIQSDVSLGVEVGIMAFKGKLSRVKGSTSRAVQQYCAGQYKVTSDTIPDRIWPVPEYRDTKV